MYHVDADVNSILIVKSNLKEASRNIELAWEHCDDETLCEFLEDALGAITEFTITFNEGVENHLKRRVKTE